MDDYGDQYTVDTDSRYPLFSDMQKSDYNVNLEYSRQSYAVVPYQPSPYQIGHTPLQPGQTSFTANSYTPIPPQMNSSNSAMYDTDFSYNIRSMIPLNAAPVRSAEDKFMAGQIGIPAYVTNYQCGPNYHPRVEYDPRAKVVDSKSHLAGYIPNNVGAMIPGVGGGAHGPAVTTKIGTAGAAGASTEKMTMPGMSAGAGGMGTITITFDLTTLFVFLFIVFVFLSMCMSSIGAQLRDLRDRFKEKFED